MHRQSQNICGTSKLLTKKFIIDQKSKILTQGQYNRRRWRQEIKGPDRQSRGFWIELYDQYSQDYQLQLFLKLMEQQPKIIKKPTPYQPIKYFIAGINTYLGQQLVLRLRNQNIHPQNPNRIIGSLSNKDQENVPNGVRKVIDKSKIRFSQQILLDSDVIILDLNTCDLDEAEFTIATLKVQKFDVPKILICISSVMTWAITPPKQKKEEEGQDQDDGAGEEPDTEDEGKQENVQGKKTYVRFTDKDFTLRRPAPSYQKMKSIETLCLAAGNVRKQLKSYVLCSGILYGNGQRIFQQYFQQARLQIPEQLSYFGDGKNRIPMVHVKDLVTYVTKIVQRPPKNNYLLAIDHNPKPTLKKIVQSISNGMGTGKIKQVPIKQIKNADILTLNIRMKPTQYFIKLQEEQASIEVEQGSDIQKFKFEWHCKEGLQKNIKKLGKEYNETRGFIQTKIFVNGPPASGKSYYSKILAKKYYLPHLDIKSIIQRVRSLQNNPLSEEVNTFLTTEKQRLVQQGNTEFQERKQKWSKLPKEKRQPLEPFNPDKIVPRLSEELVYKCFQWRLSQNDCLNRGYVLDGYPRTYQNAKNIFMMVEAQQQNNEENTQKIVNLKAIPSIVFILEATDQTLLENLKKLPEKDLEGTHFNEKDMKRRLKNYRKRNQPNTGNEIVDDFFIQNNVQIYRLKISEHLEKTMEAIVKPLRINESQKQRLASQTISQSKTVEQINKKKQDQNEKLSRDIQRKDYEIKKHNEQNQQRQILQKKSLALRKYLDANVVPFLVEGIHEIIKQLPQNPVDYLAEFLFKMSLKVPNPDPSTFEF